MDTVYTFREHGYSTGYIIGFYIAANSKNSNRRVINIEQASLSMSREDLYYMVNVAVLLGAERSQFN